MYILVNENKKWKRSTEGYLAGVCEGLGQSFNVNPNILRAVWIVSIMAFGTGIFLYLLLSFILPREDKLDQYHEDKLLGVCRRISERSGIELPIVRFLSVILAISSLGITALIYVLLHFILEGPSKKISL